MSEWKDTRLGDICTIVGRIGFRGYTAKDLVETPDKGAISLSPTNIANFELNLSKVTYISWEKYYESPEIMVAPGDIVFSKTGTVGWSALIKDVVHPITLNPQLVVFKDIKINPVYLSYVMRSHLFKGLVKNITGGSAVPTLTQKDLGNLEFPVADSETQEKIASILSSLDDKIAINKKICENLEAQAQALFKHWFVDFAPFKDGKFVESELGLIPEGWRVGRLEELCSFISRGLSPKYQLGTNELVLGQTCVRNNIVTLNNAREHLPKTNCNRYVRKWDVLLNSTGIGSLGRVGIVYYDNKNVCFDSHLTVVRTAEETYRYYVGRNLLNRQKELENMAVGSTGQTELPKKDVLVMPILIPSPDVLPEFNELIKNIGNTIYVLIEENLRLATLRDTLLPKLMSGQIKL